MVRLCSCRNKLNAECNYLKYLKDNFVIEDTTFVYKFKFERLRKLYTHFYKLSFSIKKNNNKTAHLTAI